MFGIGRINTAIRPCTREDFREATENQNVKGICELIARMEKKLNTTTDESQRKWCEKRISEAKRELPVITPMATFEGGRRSIKNAIPSGLNMLDVDHVDDPKALWSALQEKGILTAYEVVLVHITPSTHGLRIIFRQPEGKTIEDAQAEMARTYGIAYDGVTKDLARCSFLVPADYILLMDEKKLFANEKKKKKAPQTNAGNKAPQPQAAAQAEENNETAEPQKPKQYPTEFHGVPYQEIIDGILSHAGYDGTPAVGERNNALYVLCRNLRYVCDFDEDFIKALLPEWDLPRSEVDNTVHSAVTSVRKATMPSQVKTIVETRKKAYESVNDSLYEEAYKYTVDDDGLIGQFVKIQPPYMRNAAYITTITCFATLLTRLRGHGCDGSVVSPNFMTCVSAPQATGKSFMKHIYEQVLRPVKEEDNRQREKAREIKKENDRNKDKEGYEEKEFKGVIRLLPTNTSNRVLIERMDLAKDQHLMIMAEEIDSITKAEKSGKWSEKSDIYRLAYDNSEWGTDYASENSYNAVVHLYLNLLFSGTPLAVERFFNDIENGLITRFLFVDLPDTYGQKRPKRAMMSEEVKADVDKRIQQLYDQMQNLGTEDGLFWMDTTQMVADTLEYYDEVQRKMYLDWQDDVCRDLARRRYADYAVKMMMVETYLNDGVYTERIRDRVLSIMNLCTEQLIANYGDEINKSLNGSVQKHEESKKRSKKVVVLDSLPDTFTFSDYSDAVVENGGSKNTVSPYLRRLVKANVIEIVERGVYKKIVQ